MKLFRYHRKFDFPVPVIPAVVVSPTTGRKKQLSFRIDTGADYSVVPFHVLDSLGIQPHIEIDIGDYDAHKRTTSLYLVHFRTVGIEFMNIYVIPSASGSTLLGIDILNQLKLTLDGPNKSLIIH